MQKKTSVTSLLFTFFLTAGLLTVVQLKVKIPMLMLERFIPGGGWLEIGLLAGYASWLRFLIQDISQTAKIRKYIWWGFSILFFGQMVLGLIGFDKFLMTGKLHLPIPAMIIAAPLYRGSGFFMVILFLSTLLLCGPAWCSYLCYIGSWDARASAVKKRPGVLPSWSKYLRISLLICFPLFAILLRLLGVPMLQATIIGLASGLLGVFLMLFWSRRIGVMTHCVSYCPLGLVANLLGKISPWRIRFTADCTDCQICTKACRYNALQKENIQQKKVGLSCTLCGDCLAACPHDALKYHFLGMNPDKARNIFLTLVISLHAVFLGVARI